MHHIPPYETSVTLFSRDGDVTVFRSLKAAYKELGRHWIAKNVGAHFRQFEGVQRRFDEKRNVWFGVPVYVEHDFIMRDDFGDVVTLSTFESLIQRKRYYYRWSYRLENWNGEGPVPGVHRWRKGRFWRRPRTMSELRQVSLVLKEEGEVPPRPSRSVNHLPNAWDDLPISSRHDKNWKRHRKTQWKAD